MKVRIIVSFLLLMTSLGFSQDILQYNHKATVKTRVAKNVAILPIAIPQTQGALAITTSQTNVTTYNGMDGTVSVAATGGTIPYSYSWSQGASISSVTGLSAGTYTVIVKDGAGHSTSASISITQPSSTTSGLNGLANLVFTGAVTVPSINILGHNEIVNMKKQMFIDVNLFGLNTKVDKDRNNNAQNIFINEASVYGLSVDGGLGVFKRPSGDSGKFILLKGSLSYLGKSFPDPSNTDTNSTTLAVYGLVNTSIEMELVVTNFLDVYGNFNYECTMNNVDKFKNYFGIDRKEFSYSELGVECLFNVNNANTTNPQSIRIRFGGVLYNGLTENVIKTSDSFLPTISIGFINPFFSN